MNETEMTRERRAADHGRRHGLSAFRLKTIGAVLMALQVASTTLVPLLLGEPSADNMTALTTAVICEIASWAAVPIYAWLVYDGWRHTGDRMRYGARLAVVAIIAELPYGRMMTGSWFGQHPANPMWGLVFAYIVLVCVDWIARRYAGAMRWLLTVAVIAAGVLWNVLLQVGVRQQMMYTGVTALAFVLVYALLHGRENTMMFTAGLLGAVMCITPGVGVAFLHYRNGRLGYARPWTRWVFYALYPAMLLVGALLS